MLDCLCLVIIDEILKFMFCLWNLSNKQLASVVSFEMKKENLNSSVKCPLIYWYYLYYNGDKIHYGSFKFEYFWYFISLGSNWKYLIEFFKL